MPYVKVQQAVPWLGWFVVGLWPWGPGFNPSPFCVGFVIDKVAVRWVF